MNQKVVRTGIQACCYYIIPLITFVLLFAPILSYPDKLELGIQTGVYGIIVLILLLFVKPISILLPKVIFLKKIVALRRELGVLSFWLVFFHGVFLITHYELLTTGQMDLLLDVTGVFFWGIIGLFGMTILAITSNNFSSRKLGRNWKKLHYSVYPIFLISAIHADISEGFPKYTAIFIVYVILKYLAYKKIKKKG